MCPAHRSDPEERAARRRTILDAAARVFESEGFATARVREIAARAGVAEGTIYLYFEGKDDLLLTIFRRQLDDFCHQAEALIEDPRPFEERLSDFITAQFRQIEELPSLATVLLLESRQSVHFYGERVREVLRNYSSTVDRLLESGREAGEVADHLDLVLARRMLIGFLEEIELSWLAGDRARPLLPLAGAATHTLLQGIAPRGERSEAT